MARRHLLVFVDEFLILEKIRVVGKAVDVRISFSVRGVVDGVFKHLSDVVFRRFEHEQFGKLSARYDLLPVLFAVFFQAFCGDMQVRDLLQQAVFPHFFDFLVRFVLKAGIINVALGVFVIEPAFQPPFLHVDERAVLRNVLFFHHSDFLIKPSSEIARVETALVHIVVHRLLFRRRDDCNVKFRQRTCLFEIHGLFHFVVGVTVMSNRGARGHNLGEFADEIFSVHAVLHIQKIGVSVKMIEVFQKRKIQRGFHSLVGLAHRKHCRKFNRKLLVGYGGFEHGFVFWFETRAEFLLYLLASSHKREFPSQIVVCAMTEKLVRKPHGLVFRPVCENTTQFRKRAHFVLRVAFGIDVFPVEKQFFDVFGFLFKRVE